MTDKLEKNHENILKRSVFHDWGIKTKTVTEYLQDALDLLGSKEKSKDGNFSIKTVTEAFEAASPWLEGVAKTADYASEFFRPIKLIARIATDLTKITDPEKLGYIACTTAFQNALRISLGKISAPADDSHAIQEVKEQLKEISFDEVDFGIFTLENARSHEFVSQAANQAHTALIFIGYNEPQRNEIITNVKIEFIESLSKLLTDGETAEKFTPFRNYISLGREDRIARKNLSRHAEYQLWQFNSAPVLGREPFALKDVFVEPECGFLRWKDIHPEEETINRRNKEVERLERKNPFDEKHGGRHKMVDLVVKLIADEKEKEPVIIQGFAGSGKTSFTLRLCEKLIKEGLSPIRVRLRDITLSKDIEDALPQAVRLSNEEYVDKNPLISDVILKEKGAGDFSEISRYVLILDGWDELSVSASEGFRAKVEKMLEQLKNYIKYKPVPLKVILTGRPSTEVTDNAFLKESTPILTVRDSSPDQLEEFVNKITDVAKTSKITAFQKKLKDAPRDYLSEVLKADEMPLEIEDWEKLTKAKFTEILKTYRRNPKEIEVLGLPLLAHLASRLIAVWKDDALQLVYDKTLLYRNLINLTCEKAGKASVDERDEAESVKEQSRFWGNNLRKLLWGTASAMSIFGEDSISHDELQMRLESEEELKTIVEEIAEKNWLSSLLISFYFKGGSKELGCEFSHKSFREYLFAEAIVETLKNYGRTTNDKYFERENYWEDFDGTDERYKFSRKISRLFAARELTPDVYIYLENLLVWEVNRANAKDKVKDVGLKTKELTLEEWRKIRDGLTDIWSWWLDKVHLRPRMITTKRQNVEYESSFVHELIEYLIPYTEGKKVPLDSKTLDTSIGKTLFILTALAYTILRDVNLTKGTKLDEFQSMAKGKISFKPLGKSGKYSRELFDRIQFLGYYHHAQPTAIINLGSLDFEEGFLSYAAINNTLLSSANFSTQIIHNSNFYRSDFSSSSFSDTHLYFVGFSDVKAFNANFANTIIQNCGFDNSVLVKASFVKSRLRFSDFSQTDLAGADFTKATVNMCDFSNANCEHTIFNDTNLLDCSFYETNFRNANLSKTIGLTREQLKNAHINAGTKLPKELEQHKEYFIRLTEERMKANKSGDVELVEVDESHLDEEE